jgi:hypothetical protein
MLQNLSDPHAKTEAFSHHSSLRAAIGALVLVVCCLLSTARLVMHAPTLGRPTAPDLISLRSDQRFARLKTLLPTRGVVGYVDAPGNSNAANYYLAQYALAPLLVDYSPQHSLVVGNFPAKSLPPDLSPNLRLIKDFGNGVLLFANKDVR